MRGSKRKASRLALSVVAFAATSAVERIASAASYYWNNTATGWQTNGAWSTAAGGAIANWPSTTADTAFFTIASSSNQPSNPGVSISRVLFQSTASNPSIGGYIISGTPISLSGTAATSSSAITFSGNNGGGTETFSDNVVFTAAAASTQTIYAGAAQNTLTFSGAISSKNTISLALDGPGTINLNATNNYSGTTTITAGTVNFNANTATSSGLVMVAATTAIDNTSGNAVTLGSAFSLTGGNLNFLGSNNLAINGNIALGASAFLTVGGSVLTVAGNVSDGGSSYALTKVGNGTLALAGSNTFAGGLNVNAGQVNFNSAGSAGTGAITFASGISFDNTSGAGLSVANGGLITINNMTFGGVGNLTLGSGNVFLSTSKNLTLGGSGSVLAFGGTLTQGATGTPSFIVRGAGNTLVLGGISLVNTSGTTGNGILIGGDANVYVAGAVINATSFTNGTFSYNGTGKLTLAGANTYNLLTQISAGTLVLGSTSALGNSPTATISNGAKIDLNGQNYSSTVTSLALLGDLTNSSTTAANFAGDVAVSSGGTVDGTGDITLSGNTSGNTSFTKNGNNTLVLTGSSTDSSLSMVVNSGTVILAKASTASNITAIRGTNGLVINGGTVQLGGTGGNQILDVITGAATAPVVINGGTFDVNTRNETVGNLTLGTSVGSLGTITGTTGVLSAYVGTSGNGFFVNGGSVSAVLGGGNGLTKQSASTVVISSASSYSGATTVSQGTLDVSGSIAGSTVVLVNGGVLQFDNSFGDATGLSAATSLTIASGSVNISTGGTEQVAALTLGTTVEGYGTYNSTNSGGYITFGSIIVAPVPEPTSIGLIGIAGTALLAGRRRRRLSHANS